MAGADMTGTRAPERDLESLFRPNRVAVVGASRSPGKLGAALARSLAAFAGDTRSVALVNSRDATMYDSISSAAADQAVDLAMICVPAPACPGVLAEAAVAGVRAAVICGGGFAEAGGSGVALQRQLAETVAATGIRLLGPNTSGFLSPPTGLIASFVAGAALARPGAVGVVAASGGVNHALAFLLTEAGHGLSLGVGLGNGVDVTAADVLDHLATDPSTRAIALHVESVADGRRLVAAVSRAAALKPVVALVVGRHDVGAFAASHTGALATSWRTTRAALAQAGAVLVDDERELVDAVGALSLHRLPPAADPGAGVVTAQAGPGLLLLDELRGRGVPVREFSPATQQALGTLLPPLTFQRNPVDTGRPGPELTQILTVVARDPASDVIAGYALHEPDAVDLVDAITAMPANRVPVVFGVGGTGEAVLTARDVLMTAGVAVAADPHGVATMIAALVADARARYRRARPSTPAGNASRLTVAGGDFDEHAAKEVLELAGIATMQRRACSDRAQAHSALAELGAPVAVKLLDASVLHKTEVGGVHLGIRTAAELDEALNALERVGARRFLVESMAGVGVDLVVGARRDPVFGPVVLFGLGGTAAEAVPDVSVRLAPLTVEEAADMPAELAGHALLDGWRGGPVLDPVRAGQVTASLGDLLAANPWLDEIEINPLRLTATGLVALDAVLITRAGSEA
jgi:acetate---CoA ligase (ADP-forming)